MLPRNHPDRIQIAFDDPRLVANAGLLLPVTLAQHLGLREVVDSHVDLGDAPGRANPGDKLLTLVASALAGGDFIDDADVFRTGGTAGTIGCVVKAPSTLGTFLRSFRWGHVRQLDRVSRELLSRAWAAGTGPGEGPLTIDLDSTMCETYGLAKEGARHHGYTGQRGYHPLLAIAASTGEVLMSRLREGRVRHAGARGQLTVRADSRFYAHALVVVCREMDVRFSITIRQHARLRELIEAIPEEDWTPVPYWMDGGADVAETTYTPLPGRARSRPSAAHRPAGEAHARFPTGPLRQLQLLQGNHRPVVTDEIVEYAVNRHSLPIYERAGRLLRFLSKQTAVAGEFISLFQHSGEFTRDSYGSPIYPDMPTNPTFLAAMAWSESISPDEISYLVDYLEENGWLHESYKGSDAILRSHEYQVTVSGHVRIAEESANADASQAFVAMWFDDSVERAYNEGIAPAIRDCGFEPKRIDRDPRVDKIDDSIIAEIRRSRFLVADFTHGNEGARGGVYYEAGFAHGLEIPVIFTCRADAIDKIHFDTRQYSHIAWASTSELRNSLRDRILARIGEGPNLIQ